MDDMTIALAYLVSAYVLTWAAMWKSVPPHVMRERRRPSESDAHIFSCMSIATAYAWHAVS